MSGNYTKNLSALLCQHRRKSIRLEKLTAVSTEEKRHSS